PGRVDQPGDGRRGVAVRLRFLPGLYEPGARPAGDGAAQEAAELHPALVTAPGRQENAARPGAAGSRRTPDGRTAGENRPRGQAVVDRRGAALFEARLGPLPQSPLSGGRWTVKAIKPTVCIPW